MYSKFCLNDPLDGGCQYSLISLSIRRYLGGVRPRIHHAVNLRFSESTVIVKRRTSSKDSGSRP